MLFLILYKFYLKDTTFFYFIFGFLVITFWFIDILILYLSENWK